MDENTKFARHLRHEQTPQEQKMWKLLRNRNFEGLKFYRQVPVGQYIVDFICKEKNLVIEIDGGQHNGTEQIEYDRQRSEYLNSVGYKVVRFWNNEIDGEPEGVYMKLLSCLDE